MSNIVSEDQSMALPVEDKNTSYSLSLQISAVNMDIPKYFLFIYLKIFFLYSISSPISLRLLFLNPP